MSDLAEKIWAREPRFEIVSVPVEDEHVRVLQRHEAEDHPREVPAGTVGATSRSSQPGSAGIGTRRAGKLYKARSRLYRSQNLQVNTRWKALAEIYTMHSFAPLSNLNFFVKIRQNFFAIELMNIH